MVSGKIIHPCENVRFLGRAALNSSSTTCFNPIFRKVRRRGTLRVEKYLSCAERDKSRRDGRKRKMKTAGRGYVPVLKVSSASCGSQCCQISASWEKFTPMSSCPRAGNTNCSLNVRDNRSVKFRKHCRRSSTFMPVVRVSASLQQVVTGSLVYRQHTGWLRVVRITTISLANAKERHFTETCAKFCVAR